MRNQHRVHVWVIRSAEASAVRRRFSLFVSSAKGHRMQEGLFKIGNVGQRVVCALFRAGIHSFGLSNFAWPAVSARGATAPRFLRPTENCRRRRRC